MNEYKKEYELYCSSCGNAIKKEAVICPYCKTQVKDFDIKYQKLNIRIIG